MNSYIFSDEFGIGYCLFPGTDRWEQVDAYFKEYNLPEGSVLLLDSFAFESEEEAEAWYRDIAPQVDYLNEMGKLALEYPDFQGEYANACREVYRARGILV